MAANVLVDASYLAALLSRRDSHHRWSALQAERLPPPWKTCEAVLSEAFHLMAGGGLSSLTALLSRGAVIPAFDLGANLKPVLKFMRRYADVPASLADACLVRMIETFTDPVLLTADADFRVYRRHGRQVIPCVMPTDTT